MSSAIRITVIVLNYNGMRWIEKCLQSLRAQSIFPEIEVIIADNRSSDGSDVLAESITRTWPNGRLHQNGGNLGYCEGNNRPAEHASGEYLFFLNNDTWLEPTCLENLLREVQQAKADAASPLVLNYGDDSIQPVWVTGFDCFGFPSFATKYQASRPLFMPPGCSFLIRRDLFFALGQFDREIFMYADEFDLSWRVWLGGGTALAASSARLHHRLAADVNPAGEKGAIEYRTSDSKRYYANRNALLVLAKDCQHVLLLLVPFQLGFLLFEALVSLVLIRRWSYVRRAYWEAVRDCWRLRGHILKERARVRTIRRRSDWQMLRFIRWRLNRWDEFVRVLRFGPPKVTPR